MNIVNSSAFAKASVSPHRYFFIGEGAEAAQTAPGTHVPAHGRGLELGDL